MDTARYYASREGDIETQVVLGTIPGARTPSPPEKLDEATDGAPSDVRTGHEGPLCLAVGCRANTK